MLPYRWSIRRVRDEMRKRRCSCRLEKVFPGCSMERMNIEQVVGPIYTSHSIEECYPCDTYGQRLT